jgi:hypothetical protein
MIRSMSYSRYFRPEQGGLDRDGQDEFLAAGTYQRWYLVLRLSDGRCDSCWHVPVCQSRNACRARKG